MALLILSNTVRNAALTTVLDLINEGLENFGMLRFYSGERPATPEDSPTELNTLLASRSLSNPAFSEVVAGEATLNAVDNDVAEDVDGVVAWCRMLDGYGNPIMDMDVDTSGASIIVQSTTISSTAPLMIVSGTLRMGTGA